MDNLGDILANKSFGEPDEVKIIKKYVTDNFKSTIGVSVHPRTIVITAANSALAGTLRHHLEQIAELCQTDKKLIIRIG